MQMTEVFDKLKSLQEVLSEKYDIEKIIEDSPKQLMAQEELLSRLKKEFIADSAVYEDNKQKVLALEVELSQAVKLREDGEKGMDNISTHREYEALDKQIKEATEKEESLRKDLDKEKKHLNEIDEKLKMDEGMIKDQETDLNSQKSSLNKQLDKHKKQLEKLEKKEDTAKEGLDKDVVSKFERIIKRNSQGIVAVKNGVCEGCHMILPAQFANEVREGDKIKFCPYCSRILFFQEAEEGEEDYFVMAEAGSLSDYDENEDEDDYDSENEDSEDYDDVSDYEDDEADVDDDEADDPVDEDDEEENN